MVNKSKSSLSQIAYDFIKEQILIGNVGDNEVITEQNIAEHLNMSRTPVKRAMTQLEEQGYVKSVHGVGTIVVGLSPKDLIDAYQVRIKLETLALEGGIQNIDFDEINEVIRKLNLLEEDFIRTNTVDVEYITLLDSMVHNTFLLKSPNNYVIKLLDMIDSRVQRYRHEAYQHTNSIVESIEQHRNLLRTVMTKDYHKAKIVLKEHIQWSYNTLIKLY